MIIGIKRILTRLRVGIQASTTLEPVIFSKSLENMDILKHFKDEDGPFLVADAADIVRKYGMWKREMPRVEPFYAVKCNPHPTVLSILAALGVGFDCASKTEIDAVFAIGVPPSRLIFAHTCKSTSHLRHAAEVEVCLMTFDNEVELHKIKECHPDAKLVIRIRADESGSEYVLGTKFGCEMDEVQHLMRIAKGLDLQVVGVSFHIGVNYTNPIVFVATIERCRKVFKIAEECGHSMTLMDVGGGFPGVNVHISYFLGGDEKMYFINDGTYGSFRNVVTHQCTYEPMAMMVISDRPRHTSSIWGPTCDSLDRVRESCLLPDMEVGEWIAFEDMGAYASAVACDFNGFEKPELRFVVASQLNSRFNKCFTWLELCDLLKEQTTKF